jgi:hypothetical protein
MKMKRMYLLIAGVILCAGVFAQSGLTWKSSAIRSGGVFQGETRLKARQVREVMAGNSDALRQYNSGRALFVTGQVIAYPCAFMLGWDLGARLGGGSEAGNNALLAVGTTGTVVGLLMAFIGDNKVKNSVSLYNSKAGTVIDIGFTQTGIGLCMRF